MLRKLRLRQKYVFFFLIKKKNVSTEPKPTTMKYTREGPRDFVPFEYEEVTIDNIKKACQKQFKEHRNCNVSVSE